MRNIFNLCFKRLKYQQQTESSASGDSVGVANELENESLHMSKLSIVDVNVVKRSLFLSHYCKLTFFDKCQTKTTKNRKGIK
jgi:hypothetical protein